MQRNDKKEVISGINIQFYKLTSYLALKWEGQSFQSFATVLRKIVIRLEEWDLKSLSEILKSLLVSAVAANEIVHNRIIRWSSKGLFTLLTITCKPWPLWAAQSHKPHMAFLCQFMITLSVDISWTNRH